MEKIEIMLDSENNKVVVIPDIIFKNKQNIDWREVEQYLQKYIGDIVEIIETKDIIQIGKQSIDEYASSNFTTRFAIPIFENQNKIEVYNIYTGCIVINCTKYGTKYFYDLVDIKKEASTPLKTIQ